jgi:ribonuclease HII
MAKNTHTSIIMNKNKDWVSAVIIDDDDSGKEVLEVKKVVKKVRVKKEKVKEVILEEVSEELLEEIVVSEIVVSEIVVKKEKKKRNVQQPLKWFFNEDVNVIEMGIDEAGRGPMFGRVYAGVVILPKDDSFNHSLMKDSKKFHNKKKLEEAAEYIKANAIAWAVEYEDETKIDEVNILQATQLAMHKGIKSILKDKVEANIDNTLLLVDGNYFKPYMTLNKSKTKLEKLRYEMIEGGDNKYTAIAAASILAKVERDRYIEELCIQNPELVERYAIDSNKGYGSKKHMDGIKQYGITKWHRRTFGICKEY